MYSTLHTALNNIVVTLLATKFFCRETAMLPNLDGIYWGDASLLFCKLFLL
jgi:hypothetical protein